MQIRALLPAELQPNVTVVETEFHAQELRALIGSAHSAVGISYHFLLFCLSSNIPALGLYANAYYELKTCGLFKLYGMEEWLVDIRNGLDPSLLAEKMHLLNSRHSELTEHLRLRNATLRASEAEFHQRMVQLIAPRL